jgi:hypothetical protein
MLRVKEKLKGLETPETHSSRQLQTSILIILFSLVNSFSTFINDAKFFIYNYWAISKALYVIFSSFVQNAF